MYEAMSSDEEQGKDVKIEASMAMDSFAVSKVADGQIAPYNGEFDDREDETLHGSMTQMKSSYNIDAVTKKGPHIDKDALELEDSLRDRWYIIRQRSQFREYWEYLVMTLAIYNCTWTPLTISFDWAMDQDENNQALIYFDLFVTVTYSIDIVVQFLTSYMQVTTGDEIMKPSKIAKRYIRGTFIIDFLSTFPFQSFLKDNNGFQAFASACQLLKVLRIRKLYSMISRSNLTIEVKAVTKIAFYSFLLFMYTHIIGCVMWWLLRTNYIWVTPTDFGNIRSRLQDPWYETGYISDAS